MEPGPHLSPAALAAVETWAGLPQVGAHYLEALAQTLNAPPPPRARVHVHGLGPENKGTAALQEILS